MTLKRLELVEVTLKSGKVIKCHGQEVAGLQKAGLLQGPVKKQEKAPGKTKEEKDTGETKVTGSIKSPKK